MPSQDEPPPAGRLDHDELNRLGEELANLTGSGLPIGPGLRAAAEEMPRGRLRSAFVSLAASFDRGDSVEEAVAAQGSSLPRHLQGLVLAGTKTGRISQILGRLVEFMNAGEEIRRKLWVSLAYPALALFLSLLVFTFLCATLVSPFSDLFKDFGVPLPTFTIFLIRVAEVFEKGFWPVFEAGVFFVGLFLFSRVLLRGPARRSLLSGVPVVGAVWKNTSLSEFCQLLALMIECRLPLGEAVRLTGEGVGDASIDRACKALGGDVDGGMPLSAAIARQPIFPKGLPRLLDWAEGQQTLAESLQMAGEMYAARARSQASFAGSVLSVVAVISILIGISSGIIGLFVPLINLIVRLSG